MNWSKKAVVEPSQKKRPNAGFTLIETLVTVTLSVMLMLGAASLFMIFLIGSTKVGATQQIRAEGEFALEQISFLLRNAIDIETNRYGQTCQPDMQEIVFRSYDGGQTILFAETDPNDNLPKIASNSGTYLTSGAVQLVDGIEFDCVESGDGRNNYVNVTFTLQKGTPGVDQARDIITQTFTTGVNIRSN